MARLLFSARSKEPGFEHRNEALNSGNSGLGQIGMNCWQIWNITGPPHILNAF